MNVAVEQSGGSPAYVRDDPLALALAEKASAARMELLRQAHMELDEAKSQAMRDVARQAHSYGSALIELWTEARRELPPEHWDRTLTIRKAFAERVLDNGQTQLLYNIRALSIASGDESASPGANLRHMVTSTRSHEAMRIWHSLRLAESFHREMDTHARELIAKMLGPDVVDCAPKPVPESSWSQGCGKFQDAKGRTRYLLSGPEAVVAMVRGEVPEVLFANFRAVLEGMEALRGANLDGVRCVVYNVGEGAQREVYEWRTEAPEATLVLRTPTMASVERRCVLAKILPGWGVGPYPGEELDAASVPRAPVVVARVTDTQGRERQLVDGRTAALMIAEGKVPEIPFSESDAMHRALDSIGYFVNEKIRGRYCARPLQYVVYQDSNAGNYRDWVWWSTGDHAGGSREYDGWGDQPGDPVLFDPADNTGSIPAHQLKRAVLTVLGTTFNCAEAPVGEARDAWARDRQQKVMDALKALDVWPSRVLDYSLVASEGETGGCVNLSATVSADVLADKDGKPMVHLLTRLDSATRNAWEIVGNDDVAHSTIWRHGWFNIEFPDEAPAQDLAPPARTPESVSSNDGPSPR